MLGKGASSIKKTRSFCIPFFVFFIVLPSLLCWLLASTRGSYVSSIYIAGSLPPFLSERQSCGCNHWRAPAPYRAHQSVTTETRSHTRPSHIQYKRIEKQTNKPPSIQSQPLPATSISMVEFSSGVFDLRMCQNTSSVSFLFFFAE
uniref:Uncharacterized protein n=1 Tax=Hucho hucho TaxID=62062 RepID=A0A4W5LMG1_9TELE